MRFHSFCSQARKDVQGNCCQCRSDKQLSSAVQVTDVDDSSGVINVRLSEMVVGNLNLRFVDRKTSEVREEGATRPEVVLRQLATRPGQVRTESVLRFDPDAGSYTKPRGW